jgi:hypothetical protein
MNTNIRRVKQICRDSSGLTVGWLVRIRHLSILQQIFDAQHFLPAPDMEDANGVRSHPVIDPTRFKPHLPISRMLQPGHGPAHFREPLKAVGGFKYPLYHRLCGLWLVQGDELGDGVELCQGRLGPNQSRSLSDFGSKCGVHLKSPPQCKPLRPTNSLIRRGAAANRRKVLVGQRGALLKEPVETAPRQPKEFS